METILAAVLALSALAAAGAALYGVGRLARGEG